MADTSLLKAITSYAVKKISEQLNVSLKPGEMPIGTAGTKKKFSGISSNGDIVVQVVNHGGYTSGGHLPSAKIRSTYADCYMLSIAKASQKILAVTNKEFYEIFRQASKGLLQDIQLEFVKLPQDLQKIAEDVTRKASEEMS